MAQSKKGLSSIALHCPSCNEILRHGKILEGKQGASLSHYLCTECAHYCMSLVFKTQVGVSSVVLITDLSFDDVRRLREYNPITSDEVLSLHEFLRRNDAALVLVAEKKEHR